MLKLSRILHAGYLFEEGGTRIAFDPVFETPFSGNCFAFPEVAFDVDQVRRQKFDAVFISHYHDDHCSFASLDLLDRATPVYIFCVHPEMLDLLRELGFRDVYELRLNSSIQIGQFKITPWRALDADVDSIFHIEVSGLNILNVVDSWIDPETFARLAKVKWDLVLWPFQTMREMEVLSPSKTVNAEPEIPPELLAQLSELNPRYVVPSSCQFRMEEWSWYNWAFFPISYAYFAQEVTRVLPNTQVLRINPGESVWLAKDSLESAGRLDWIIPIGDQNVDYQFEPHKPPQSTTEIARQLGRLDDAQMARVVRYCETELMEKSLDFSQGYFAKPRGWRLSIFDHDGKPRDFYFKVGGDRIECASTSREDEWVTEIPAVKLYAALEYGESLTSMYLRVNNSEALEDPLIRSLFDGKFAHYQRAQLLRLPLSPNPL